jgi:hypothetical protein
VTAIGPGPAFAWGEVLAIPALRVFPPIHPTPAGALPLAEVERALAELHAPGLN